MPYRIQLEFEPELDGKRRAILDALRHCGGHVDPELDGLLGVTDLVAFPGLDAPVITMPPAPATTPYVELSWGMPPSEIRTVMADLLLVADRVHCELYDPQVQAYVRGETLAHIRAHRVAGAQRLLYPGQARQLTESKETPGEDAPLEYLRGEIYRGDPVLAVRIHDLSLSLRASRVLNAADIHYIGELITRSPEDLIQLRNFGRKTLHELTALLQPAGLSLGMRVLDWS